MQKGRFLSTLRSRFFVCAEKHQLGRVTVRDPVRNADTAAEISQQEIPHRYKIIKNKRHYATLGILKFAGPSQLCPGRGPSLRAGVRKKLRFGSSVLFNADADNLRAAYYVAHRC